MKQKFYTKAIIPLDYDTIDEERIDEVMGSIYNAFTTLADDYSLEILDVESDDFTQFIMIEVIGDSEEVLSQYSYDLSHNLLPLDNESVQYITNETIIELLDVSIMPYN